MSKKQEARIIHVPVIMGIPKRKADGSVKLEFVTTTEISTDQYMIMDSYRQSLGHLLFRENLFTDDDVPDEDIDSDIGKSASAQLRDALWVLYKMRGLDVKDKASWNDFYRKNMQAMKSRILEEVHRLEGRTE